MQALEKMFGCPIEPDDWFIDTVIACLAISPKKLINNNV